MVYIGGKKKLAKFICPILQKELDSGQFDYYIEPFVGGANIIENINFKKKVACDANKELIAFYKALQDGWEMPEPYSFGREHYNEVRSSWKEHSIKYPDYYYGYMMFIPSKDGKLFGSFCEDYVYDGRPRESKIRVRKPWQEHYNSALIQKEKMKDCEFICSDYKKLQVEKALIYCDPPYASRKQDYYKDNFNSEEFYNWCRKQSKNNKIYISEVGMPDDFQVIWEKECVSILSRKRKNPQEKLFTL